MLEDGQDEQPNDHEEEKDEIEEVVRVLGQVSHGISQHDSLEGEFVAIEDEVDDEDDKNEHCNDSKQDAKPVVFIKHPIL